MPKPKPQPKKITLAQSNRKWAAFKKSAPYAALISHADAPAAALAMKGTSASVVKFKPAYTEDAVLGKVITGVFIATRDVRGPDDRVVFTYPEGSTDDKELIRRIINVQFLPWEPVAPGDIKDKMTIRQLARFIFKKQ